ncbi:MAG: DUF1223 domain-containing protein [Elusimicrobia bacterium]|nr:DUF1223 domain-containing protein [Elusimicrobiota bacterium]
MNPIRLAAAAPIFALCAHAAREAPVESFRSSSEGTALVELFSSEGCSSCPPADRWLSGLLDDERLWKDFVPVAFHVNYWDHLGWRDPLAAAEHTTRQRAYAEDWGSRGVYTPGVVLDGAEWRSWGGRPPRRPRQSPALVVERVARATFKLSFPSGGGWRGHAALLGAGLESRVRSGENEGRVLRHDFVALDYATCRAKESDCTLTLRPRAGLSPERIGVAAWVTRAGSLVPLQAAGGWLR